MAAAGALAAGSMFTGAASMLAFGLGTVPTMFAIGFLGRNLHSVSAFACRDCCRFV